MANEVKGMWISRNATCVQPLYFVFNFFSSANNPKGLLEVREALEKVHKVEDLLPIMKVNYRKTLIYGKNHKMCTGR